MSQKHTTESRTIYTPSGGKRRVWDARCDGACDCRATATTKPSALAEVTSLHAYRATAPAPIVRGGCKLSTDAPNSWWFELRSGTRTATSAGFSAASESEALEIVRRWYGDHPDVSAFFAE